VLSPEVSEQRLERTERQRRQREATTVSRLVEAGALEPGDRLQFRAPSAELQAQLEPWLAEKPERRWASWQDDTSQSLVWEADAEAYSPTGLAKLILEQGADGPASTFQGRSTGWTRRAAHWPRSPGRCRPAARSILICTWTG
jgi:hypothetical protein